MNIGKRVRRQSILHPIRTVSRTTLYNMVLFLVSVTVAGIVVAISMIRNRISFGSLVRSGIAKEDYSIAGASAEQSATPSPLKPFLVIVLPDGTTVMPRVAEQV
jgi:hypothetical protein